jgi:hypothetical protein
MSVKLEEYIRYIQEYKQRHHGCAPNIRHLANTFGLSLKEVGDLNMKCAEAGYPGLLWPLAPVYEGNWWVSFSGHGETFTHPKSLNLAIRDTEVEVDSISVEASSGKVTIVLQREGKLAGFYINQGDRREWPHYCEEIIRLLSEKDRRTANVLSGAWLPDPR